MWGCIWSWRDSSAVKIPALKHQGLDPSAHVAAAPRGTKAGGSLGLAGFQTRLKYTSPYPLKREDPVSKGTGSDRRVHPFPSSEV